MASIVDTIGVDDLPGAVNCDGRWRIYAGVVAEWILDYKSYAPGDVPAENDPIFRSNLWVVDNDNSIAFCAAMQPSEVMSEELKLLQQRQGLWAYPIVFVIDFDRRLYVNGFGEISTHEYVPAGWIGVEGDPLDYVPENVRKLWT